MTSSASTLCQACGLCCTGHLFIWVRLDARELKPCQSLGLNVITNDPRQRGFTQPCPAWDGVCTVYASPHYPRGCRSYNCKLLKELIEENISLPDALMRIEQTKQMIADLEKKLPPSPTNIFRERLVADGEQKKFGAELLVLYEKYFGVTDILDAPNEP